MPCGGRTRPPPGNTHRIRRPDHTGGGIAERWHRPLSVATANAVAESGRLAVSVAKLEPGYTDGVAIAESNGIAFTGLPSFLRLDKEGVSVMGWGKADYSLEAPAEMVDILVSEPPRYGFDGGI